MDKVLSKDLSDLEFIAELAGALARNPELKDILVGFMCERLEAPRPDPDYIVSPMELISAVAFSIDIHPEVKTEYIDVVNTVLSEFCDGDTGREEKEEAATSASLSESPTPLWLRSKAELEDYIKESFNAKQLREGFVAKEVEIMSGLDTDVPCISSPTDFSEELLDVHLKSDSRFLLLDEKCRRAKEAGSCFGWREFFLCLEKPEEIYLNWRSGFQYFSQALVKIDDVMYTPSLLPHVGAGDLGCSFNFRQLSDGSSYDGRFPLLKAK